MNRFLTGLLFCLPFMVNVGAQGSETVGTLPRDGGGHYQMFLGTDGDYYFINDSLAGATLQYSHLTLHAISMDEFVFGHPALGTTYNSTASEPADPSPSPAGDDSIMEHCWNWAQNENVRVCARTPRRGSESASHQATRHAANVNAMMDAWPPPPSGN